PTASSSADSAMIAASKIDPTTIAPNAPKSVTSPFESSIAKAEEMILKNDARGAIEAYRQALALNPESVEARLGLADSLQDIRDFASAEAEYKKITTQNPNSAEAHRGQADALYELKRYDEAVTAYQAAIKAGANDAGIYNNLGNAFFRTGARDNRDLAIEN